MKTNLKKLLLEAKAMPTRFRARATKLIKMLDHIESQKPLHQGGERPMKCVCGRKFRGFSTWFPHWKKRHPILHKRYSAAKGNERGNLMLRMMRAASA